MTSVRMTDAKPMAMLVIFPVTIAKRKMNDGFSKIVQYPIMLKLTEVRRVRNHPSSDIDKVGRKIADGVNKRDNDSS